NDGQFTGVGEEVYASSLTTSPNPFTVTGSVTIPATATPGITRMRVVLMEGGTATSTTPCGTYTWGETEDYLVEIVAALACSGQPDPTTVSGPVDVCSGTNFTLSATGMTTGL